MDNNTALDWAGAYLDWIDNRNDPFQEAATLAADARDRVDFTAAFLEWMETPPRLDRRAADKGGVAVMGEKRSGANSRTYRPPGGRLPSIDVGETGAVSRTLYCGE